MCDFPGGQRRAAFRTARDRHFARTGEFEETGRRNVNSSRADNKLLPRVSRQRTVVRLYIGAICETLSTRYVVICACLRARIRILLCEPCRLRNHEYDPSVDCKCQRCYPFSQVLAGKIVSFKFPSSYRHFAAGDRLPSLFPLSHVIRVVGKIVIEIS